MATDFDGVELIMSGDVVSGLVLSDNSGLIAVSLGGGVAIGTTVDGGQAVVYDTGTASGTTVGSGGTFVLSGGTASDTVINGGASVVLSGSVTGTTVVSGTLVLSHGSASDTTAGSHSHAHQRLESGEAPKLHVQFGMML
jgi:autotransporter passenger strand-loop-strand repeat protein